MLQAFLTEWFKIISLHNSLLGANVFQHFELFFERENSLTKEYSCLFLTHDFVWSEMQEQQTLHVRRNFKI